MESQKAVDGNKQDPLHEEEDIQLAKEIMKNFLVIFKVFSLYPSDNSQCKQSVSNAMAKLHDYFQLSDRLKLDISKYHISTEGQTIFEGEENDGNFAFLLFRDGIQWVALDAGIFEDDLAKLFRIITSQRTMGAVEEDIVTALWEAQIPYVEYYATDDLFLFGSEDDISTETIMKEVVEYGGTGEGTEEGETEESAAGKTISPQVDGDDAPPLHIEIEDNQKIITLNKDEQKYLSNLISKELKRDPGDEALAILIDAIKSDKLEENLDAVMVFLWDLFQNSLAQRDFAKVIELLEMMQEIKVLFQKENKSELAEIDKFFSVVSDPETFQVIEEDLSEGDPKQSLKLLQLVSFNVSSEEPLLETLDKTGSRKMKKALIAILIQRKSPHIETLFGFIEDEDKKIRKAIFEYVGKQKSRKGEELLTDYIQEKEFYKKNTDQVLSAFVALGRCGSSRSIPLLMKLLTRKSVFLGQDYDAIRMGAAIALKSLGTERALNILERGKESKEKSIRKACMTALVKDSS